MVAKTSDHVGYDTGDDSRRRKKKDGLWMRRWKNFYRCPNVHSVVGTAVVVGTLALIVFFTRHLVVGLIFYKVQKQKPSAKDPVGTVYTTGVRMEEGEYKDVEYRDSKDKNYTIGYIRIPWKSNKTDNWTDWRDAMNKGKLWYEDHLSDDNTCWGEGYFNYKDFFKMNYNKECPQASKANNWQCDKEVDIVICPAYKGRYLSIDPKTGRTIWMTLRPTTQAGNLTRPVTFQLCPSVSQTKAGLSGISKCCGTHNWNNPPYVCCQSMDSKYDTDVISYTLPVYACLMVMSLFGCRGLLLNPHCRHGAHVSGAQNRQRGPQSLFAGTHDRCQPDCSDYRHNHARTAHLEAQRELNKKPSNESKQSGAHSYAHTVSSRAKQKQAGNSQQQINATHSTALPKPKPSGQSKAQMNDAAQSTATETNKPLSKKSSGAVD